MVIFALRGVCDGDTNQDAHAAAFDAWLSAWEPLINAIKQRRTRLLVTLEQFCDAAKPNEDEARGIILMSRDRFPCITIDILHIKIASVHVATSPCTAMERQWSASRLTLKRWRITTKRNKCACPLICTSHNVTHSRQQ